MGPTRTPKVQHSSAEASSSKRQPSSQKLKRKHPQKEPNALQGVQKIKSSLRQARRLLAKDKLAADVRVATERRVKSLEAELAQAEMARKERNMAVRSHKIKFFERQKVVRKLNQTKKRLATASGSSKSELESAIYELRVDLNYILHYPKTKKYISLFPPEIREHLADAPKPKVNPEAEEVRFWIQEQMKSGALSVEPETTLDAKHDGYGQKSTSTSKTEWAGEKKSKSNDTSAKTTKDRGQQVVEEKDDFFEEDDEEEEEGDDDSDA